MGIFVVSVNNSSSNSSSHHRSFSVTVVADNEDLAIQLACERINKSHRDNITRSIRNSKVKQYNGDGIVDFNFYGSD